jgi:peptidoglycan hydrolase CwlO-like protein
VAAAERTTDARAHRPRSRAAASVLAALVAVAAAQVAGARPGLDAAREREERLGRRVATARASADVLQRRILALAAGIHDARVVLDRLQGQLVAAQHELASAREAYADIQSRIDERAREAFMAAAPASSAVFLLDAGSFSDLVDRTVFLGRVQEADSVLGILARAEAGRLSASRDRLARASLERVELVARIEKRSRELLAAFVEQQADLEALVGARRAAERRVGRIERRIARRTGTLPFEAWAQRFLEHMGAPVCRENLVVVVAWQANEFTEARWNPLATTHRMPGSTGFNDVGVQNFRSLHQGLRATQETLMRGAPSYGYASIVQGLRTCVGATVTAEAIRASAWCRGCSDGGYVSEIVPIVEQYFDRYSVLHA